MRAVFDPNVLVSAAISESGAQRELMNRWEAGEFELVVSAEILFELQEVLARPKFRRYLSEATAINHVLESMTRPQRSSKSCRRMWSEV